jgi:hypothetical protein
MKAGAVLLSTIVHCASHLEALAAKGELPYLSLRVHEHTALRALQVDRLLYDLSAMQKKVRCHKATPTADTERKPMILVSIMCQTAAAWFVTRRYSMTTYDIMQTRGWQTCLR